MWSADFLIDAVDQLYREKPYMYNDTLIIAQEMLEKQNPHQFFLDSFGAPGAPNHHHVAAYLLDSTCKPVPGQEKEDPEENIVTTRAEVQRSFQLDAHVQLEHHLGLPTSLLDIVTGYVTEQEGHVLALYYVYTYVPKRRENSKKRKRELLDCGAMTPSYSYTPPREYE